MDMIIVKQTEEIQRLRKKVSKIKPVIKRADKKKVKVPDDLLSIDETAQKVIIPLKEGKKRTVKEKVKKTPVRKPKAEVIGKIPKKRVSLKPQNIVKKRKKSE
jgi:hypothetical protein